MIPEYDVVVIDEAHELTARVTQAATDELSASTTSSAPPAAPSATSTATRPTTSPTPPTRCATRSPRPPPGRLDARARRSSPTRWCWCATPPGPASRRTPRRRDDGEGDAGRTQAKGSVQEVFVNAERMAADLESDVLWLSEGTERIPPRLCVAPLQVWGPMRDKLLTDKTVVFTRPR